MGRTVRLPNDTYIANDLYSTNEKIVGKWINGKPLYRKVIAITTPTVATEGTFPTNKWIATRLTNIDTIYIKNAFIVADNIKYNIPYITKSGGRLGIIINSTNDGMEVITNTTIFSNKNGYAILEYTKTTD